MGAIDPSDYKPEVLEHVYQPWSIEVKQYPEGGYFARVVELSGCMTEGDSAAEVLEALEEARAEWIAAALEQGLAIPTPFEQNDYSGKVFVRTSPALHRMIAEEAAKQGVSMSQWVSEAAAIKIGVRQAFKAVKDWVARDSVSDPTLGEPPTAPKSTRRARDLVE